MGKQGGQALEVASVGSQLVDLQNKLGQRCNFGIKLLSQEQYYTGRNGKLKFPNLHQSYLYKGLYHMVRLPG